MGTIRKPLQGVTNIIRFNWHFYVLSAIFIASLLVLNIYTNNRFTFYVNIAIATTILVLFLSLAVSFYIYDLSNLYSLSWLENVVDGSENDIINVHAGFDETSELLQTKFPGAKLRVFDFYDPLHHTELSIKRARAAYPAYPQTIPISTQHIPIADGSCDVAYSLFSAHEIRSHKERVAFFKELNRILTSNGKIIVTEHLRDSVNFLAYNIGFLHFLSKNTWNKTFARAGLQVKHKLKITPFITTFILQKNGTAS